jgi:hypothetical protein
MNPAYWTIVLFLSLAVLPLGLAWKKGNKPRAALALLTLDALFFAAAAIWTRDVLGHSYSKRLYTTIEINLFLSGIAAVFFAAKRQWYGAGAATLLLCNWLYAYVLNAAA